MPTKLSIFNTALALLGEPPLTSVDEHNEAGRVLRGAWEQAALYCLEEGPWNFGKVMIELPRLAETPDAGYAHYFQKPIDWLKTIHVSADGSRNAPWPQFEDLGRKLASDEERLFMLYVSRTAIDRPGDWSNRFADYVAHRLAILTCERITGSRTRAESLVQTFKRMEQEATSHNDSSQRAQTIPTGSWVRAARQGWGGRRR